MTRLNTYFFGALLTTVMATSVTTAFAQPVHNITQGTDHPTIQQAINAAVTGDEIVADPGTYFENVDYAGKAVTVRSTDPADPVVVAATIIDGGAAGSVVRLSSGTISGFTIQNGFETGANAGGIEAEGTAVVSHNVITGNVAEDRGGGVSAVDTVVVRNNRIYNNTAGKRAGGISARDDSIVIDNIISGNQASSGGGGVRAQENALIRNNTITTNSSEDSGGGATGGGGVLAEESAVIVNNIIAFNTDGAGLHIPNGATVTADYNCVFGNFEGEYGGLATPGANDLNIDPGLDSDGVHLTEPSPCINAGDPALIPLPDESDIDGELRVSGMSADIGSDEIQDCNGNGIPDYTDIANGTSLDCNEDMIPDECQLEDSDCNADSIPDDCQIPAVDDLFIAGGVFAAEAENGIEAGDLNNDGIFDLATCRYESSHVTVLLGTGDGSFGEAGISQVGSPEQIQMGDLNNDGNLDVVTDAVEPGIGGSIAVLFGHGDGTFEPPLHIQDDGDFLGGPFEVADMDADGDLDIVATNDLAIFILWNDGQGSFTADFIFLVDLLGICTLAVGDLDGDGDKDLVEGNCGNNFETYSNQGNGVFTFLGETVAPPLQDIFAIELGDFDEDGDPDVVINSGRTHFAIYPNPGNGIFDDFSTYLTLDTGPNFEEDLEITDINGDGSLDVMLRSSGGSLGIVGILGQGEGQFSEPLVLISIPGPQDYFAVADLDRDGDLDIAAQAGETSVQIYLHKDGDGNGNGIPDECEGVACEGDANGDDVVDPLDAGYVQARFGCLVGVGDSECDAADVNADLFVDPLDTGYVLARLGECS